MTIKDKIMVYIYKKKCDLEKEKETLSYQLRYQPNDNLDLYENMLSNVRVQAFNEFVDELFQIIINCK